MSTGKWVVGTGPVNRSQGWGMLDPTIVRHILPPLLIIPVFDWELLEPANADEANARRTHPTTRLRVFINLLSSYFCRRTRTKRRVNRTRGNAPGEAGLIGLLLLHYESLPLLPV